MRNRRSARRINYSVSLEVFTDDDVIPASAMNLSSGGVGINMERPLEANAVVGMSLFLVEEGIEDETSPTLHVRGKVMWCREKAGSGYAAGIRLRSLNPGQLQRLQHLLERMGG